MSFAERSGKPRSPKEIATEILAAKGVKSNGEETETFEKIVEEIADPNYASDTIGVDENSDPNDPLVAEARESQNFAHLLAALRAARDGTELTQEQKTAIRTSARLINLSIAATNYVGGELFDDSQKLTPQAQELYRNVLGIFGNDEIPEHIVEEIRTNAEEQAAYHAALRRMYQSTIPLLEELANALHIQFDKPRGGII